jgi:hypothetical protein
VPLYYTGLTKSATVIFEGDKSTAKVYPLDRMYRIDVEISMCNLVDFVQEVFSTFFLALSPYGITWFLVG